jgi:hypothetical protein
MEHILLEKLIVPDILCLLLANPDTEIRSSGRVYRAALYRTARPDDRIRIRHLILSQVNPVHAPVPFLADPF